MVNGISSKPPGMHGIGLPGADKPIRKPDAAPSAARLDAPTRSVVEMSEFAVAARSSAEPPIDVARVAALRAALADGSYALDLDTLADRMIDLDIDPERMA